MDKMKGKFMDIFRIDKANENGLSLPYDFNKTLQLVTVMREFCQEIKKIGSFGLATYSIIEGDKKSKKKSLQGLSELFEENSAKLSPNDPSRGPLQACKTAFHNEHNLTISLQKNLDASMLVPLNQLETKCLGIQDHYRRLNQLEKELASATDRLSVKMTQSDVDEVRKQAAKEAVDELQSQLDSESDVYLQKILLFEAENFQIAEIFNEMVLLRAEYHEKCYKTWKDMMPDCNRIMEENRKPVSFGTPLETHLKETQRTIAYPIDFCIKSLSNIDKLKQEGLFRVSGSKNKADLLCEILNTMKAEKVEYNWPANVVADALKRYLRQMPVQLLGKVALAEWEKCYEMYQSGDKENALWNIQKLLQNMPKAYIGNSEYLLKFLTQVVAQKSHNLMGIQNICTVFVPNLFKQDASDTTAMNMDSNSCLKFILEMLLTKFEFFFPHSNPGIQAKENIQVNTRRTTQCTDTRKIKSRVLAFTSDATSSPNKSILGSPTRNADVEIKYKRNGRESRNVKCRPMYSSSENQDMLTDESLAKSLGAASIGSKPQSPLDQSNPVMLLPAPLTPSPPPPLPLIPFGKFLKPNDTPYSDNASYITINSSASPVPSERTEELPPIAPPRYKNKSQN